MKEQVKNDSKPVAEKKPNDTTGILVSSQIKIFDPNTNQVLVQKRAS